jgi:Protein of unknown function (DUF3253)
MAKALKKILPKSQDLASSDEEDLRQRLMERLKKLPAGTTMCPGKLAKDCGTVLDAARGDLLHLASAGEVRLSQHGKTVNAQELKGPFRVSLQITSKSKRVQK